MKYKRYRKDGKRCTQCGSRLPTNRWRYCCHQCYRDSQQIQFLEVNPKRFRGSSTASTGAISELRVAIDLLAKGYHVFRALSPSCPCDLAILKDDKLLRIEVKTSYRLPSGKIQKTFNSTSKNKTDHYALVLPNEIIFEPPLPQQSTENQQPNIPPKYLPL